MAWNMTMESSHGVKLSKDKHNEQLVLGLVSSGLSPVSQGAYAETQKRPRRQAMANWLEDPDSDDMCDELSNPVEKKRRLTVEQVQFLEMSFNADVKLEPERKALIAKQLGLRPRQVAIWFQNRRVRWKNKQLEQDYEVLKSKYDTLVKHNSTVIKEKEAAVMENEKLKAEVAHLTALLQSSRNHVVVSDIIDATMVKVTALPDFDSDSESGSKEDVTSASKSCDPADTQDSCRSDPPSKGVVLAIVDPPNEEMNSFIAVKVEAESLFFDESSANSYNPFLYLNGCFVDDPLAGMNNHLDSYGLGDELDYSCLCLGI